MKISLIGAGVMGETILAGMLKSGVTPDQITVAEIRPDRAAELSATYDVTCADIQTSVADANLVFIVVKPQDVLTVLAEISSLISAEAVVASLAAGITCETVESHLPSGQAVVRVMPNTPALVGEGMSGLSAGSNCSEQQLKIVADLLNTVGQTVEIPEELQDALTAVSGSGPAYLFYVMEAMTAAAIKLGLSSELATKLVTQTIFGAATLVRTTGDDPKILRERVSSPNGVTVAATRTLDELGVADAFHSAMQAAVARSIELGQ
ncbi:MAG: pyrroline-5-carboxylate reductase [Actinomycetales bacterium]|nr:pyrroline-5-carboxylate reductase [Actinomycetales bacterium]